MFPIKSGYLQFLKAQNKMFSNHTREGHRTAVESHENATLTRLQRKLLEYKLKPLHPEQSVRLFK